MQPRHLRRLRASSLRRRAASPIQRGRRCDTARTSGVGSRRLRRLSLSALARRLFVKAGLMVALRRAPLRPRPAGPRAHGAERPAGDRGGQRFQRSPGWLAILGDRGDGDFDRFLALSLFFGAVRQALVEQCAGIEAPARLGPSRGRAFPDRER